MRETKHTAGQVYADSKLAKDLYVLRQLVVKDFKLKYRRSVLGIAWSVLNPLFMMVVQSLVFTYIFRHSIENYPLYLIIGNVTFSFMSEATKSSLRSITGSASLLKKIRIDRIVFPIQKVLFSLVNYAFSLVAVALVMIVFRVVPSWQIILFPIILLMLTVFCIGLAMALSAAVVFFRDVIHLWGVVITAWMYFTPIFWDFDTLVGGNAPAAIIAIVNANPMNCFVTCMRDIMLWHQVPSMETMALCLVWSVVMLLFGLWVFRKNEHKFILYI